MTTTEIKHRPGTLTPLNAPQLDFILLDGSSSMKRLWWDTLGAIDGYIDELRTQNINSHILLRIFSGTCGGLSYDTARNEAIGDFLPLASHPVGSYWGSAPLFDAMNEMGLELKSIDPTRCSIIIATDGENTHSETTEEQARAILDWCRAKGWQVTFIGCDFNNSTVAKALGANPSSAIGVEKSHLTSAARSLGKKRANYARYGAPMHWSESEQQQFGGYLSAPERKE